MNTEYIIVQAGGRGSRMDYLTKNRPKAMVPVNNLPMIFHLFRNYPDKHFIIIGDYKFDVLEKYLKAFASADYVMVNGSGHTGTCAGLRSALQHIPEKKSFVLIWCDLILPSDFTLPKGPGNYIGISKDFVCRWKYENGVFQEEKSAEHGVAGFFIFNSTDTTKNVPEDGEFVRWLQSCKIQFNEIPLYKTREYGLLSEWEKLEIPKCRPFNQMVFTDTEVVKTPIDEQGKKLADREVMWYKTLEKEHVSLLPKIYSYTPLRMERIKGKNIYEYQNLTTSRKKEILTQVIECLDRIHKIGKVDSDAESYYEAYIGKTFSRLEKVYDLVPFAKEPTVTVNGKVCRNVFFHRDELEKQVMEYMPNCFCLLHGDCTFSNMLLRDDSIPIMIDPRGYFGTTELYGDPAYDWVKLYYSLVSNYDQFNLKRFRLEIGKEDVKLQIDSNHWEDMESFFFQQLERKVSYHQMRLLLAIVWLSLTTYAWEDYDSICGAFYNGLYYLEGAL